MEKRPLHMSFVMRVIHNEVKDIISKSVPKSDLSPQTQLQGGIMGYLFHHKETPVYQKDIEKEFRVSRATATNTLQVMEKNGLIIRKNQDKDARLKRIIMTPEAEANHARVEAHMKMMDERMLQGLSEEETEELSRYLHIIMDNLEQLRAECSAAENEERKDACVKC